MKPAADKMIDFYNKQGELPLAKTIAAACSDISKQEIFEGFARQFKDKQAAKEEIDRLRNIISQNSAANSANASSSASMTEKKSSKTEKKPIREQTLEEFLSYVVESANTDANEKKTNIESTNGKKTDDFANQKTVSLFSFLFFLINNYVIYNRSKTAKPIRQLKMLMRMLILISKRNLPTMLPKSILI